MRGVGTFPTPTSFEPSCGRFVVLVPRLKELGLFFFLLLLDPRVLPPRKKNDFIAQDGHHGALEQEIVKLRDRKNNSPKPYEGTVTRARSDNNGEKTNFADSSKQRDVDDANAPLSRPSRSQTTATPTPSLPTTTTTATTSPDIPSSSLGSGPTSARTTTATTGRGSGSVPARPETTNTSSGRGNDPDPTPITRTSVARGWGMKVNPRSAGPASPGGWERHTTTTTSSFPPPSHNRAAAGGGNPEKERSEREDSDGGGYRGGYVSAGSQEKPFSSVVTVFSLGEVLQGKAHDGYIRNAGSQEKPFPPAATALNVSEVRREKTRVGDYGSASSQREPLPPMVTVLKVGEVLRGKLHSDWGSSAVWPDVDGSVMFARYQKTPPAGREKEGAIGVEEKVLGYIQATTLLR